MEEFQKFYPEETKKRLGIIVNKIDEDKDEKVTVKEGFMKYMYLNANSVGQKSCNI